MNNFGLDVRPVFGVSAQSDQRLRLLESTMIPIRATSEISIF